MDPKKYKENENQTDIVCEPPAFYGAALQLDETKRYTYADYLTWMDNKRRELIDGFIHLMSGPLELHARLTHLLDFFMEGFIQKKKGGCRVYHAPFDVRLPINQETADNRIYNVVQPDICVICDPSKIDNRGCLGAPDLVVEVLSPSTLKYDWNYKFNLYEASGVAEYWIVDPKANVVYVFMLQPDGKYDLGTVYEAGQKVPVSTLKGFEIDLKELFEG